MTKICIKCKMEKSIEEFGTRKQSKDGHHYYCKLCANAAIEKHYAEHPEMLEVKRQKHLEYVKNNPEKVAEAKRRSREKNRPKERVQALIKRRTLRGRFNTGKNNTKRRGIPFALTFEDWVPIVADPCYYCGGDLAETGIGVDRVNNDIGYVKDNLVSCCYFCNSMKSTLSVLEFFKHVKKITEYHPYIKWLKEENL